MDCLFVSDFFFVWFSSISAAKKMPRVRKALTATTAAVVDRIRVHGPCAVKTMKFMLKLPSWKMFFRLNFLPSNTHTHTRTSHIAPMYVCMYVRNVGDFERLFPAVSLSSLPFRWPFARRPVCSQVHSFPFFTSFRSHMDPVAGRERLN